MLSPGQYHAPGSSFLPASAERAPLRSRATRAQSRPHLSAPSLPREFLILLRPTHTSNIHDQVARLRAPPENSAPPSGYTYLSRTQVGPGPLNSLDHGAFPRLRAPAPNYTHR